MPRGGCSAGNIGRCSGATRRRADALDDEAEARAGGDAAEIIFENAIRTLDSALVGIDRDHPGRGARGAVFPNGFGEVIEPEGDAQLTSSRASACRPEVTRRGSL